MFYRKLFAIILGGTLVLGQPASAAEKLTEAQIRALAPGQYVGSWKNKISVNLRLDPNGSIYGYVKGIYRRGSWYVDNGQFCLTFSILIFSRTECGEILRDGSSYIGLFKKGKPRLRMRQV